MPAVFPPSGGVCGGDGSGPYPSAPALSEVHSIAINEAGKRKATPSLEDGTLAAHQPKKNRITEVGATQTTVVLGAAAAATAA